jgi:3-dehydroquinate dehydratase/shikimate dehydrogenase
MIIVSITGPTMADAEHQMALSRRYADLFEIRLDLMRRPRLVRLLGIAGRPVIATCRPVWEGGGYRGAEHDRIEILEQASVLGAAYVDVELRAGVRTLAGFLERRRHSKVILSWHQQEGEPFRPRAVTRRLLDSGADVLKLAYRAQDTADLRHALGFLHEARAERRRAIAVPMGEAGVAGRVLYRTFGGWAMYASAAQGQEAAEGQVPASVLRTLYRAPDLTRSTRIFGVVGHPVSHSRGVTIHNPLLAAADVNAVYCRFPVRNLPAFMRHIAPRLAGFSVTLPHKERMIRYLGAADAAVDGTGAVNTVLRRGMLYRGYNTDAAAALDAVEEKLRVRGRHVLVLGAGGAARAVAWEAKRRGAAVLVSGRTAERAARLARALGVTAVPWNARTRVSCDVLVNATSVGMAPHADATPYPGPFRRGMVVLDAVYTPPGTRLLAEASAAGAQTVPGTEMYLRQAAAQFRLYTGRQPSLRFMRRLLTSPPAA